MDVKQNEAVARTISDVQKFVDARFSVEKNKAIQPGIKESCGD